MADEENAIKEEYKRAKAEHRQPICPYCSEPLEVCQTQAVYISWNWNEQEKKFINSNSGGDADKPYCASCEAHDWDFIDFDLVNF